MATSDITTPGVYVRPRVLAAPYPGVRTDVAGFVGIAGPRHLHRRVRLDDYRSFVTQYLRDDDGRPVTPPPGAYLADAVRWFFANGGARCYVVNVAPSTDVGGSALDALAMDLLGVPRSAGPERTGLELLLMEEEVAFVAIPDLHARVARTTDEAVAPWPPVGGDGAFHRCGSRALPPLPERRSVEVDAPLFTGDRLIGLTRAFVERCGRVPWKVFALVDAPYDPASPASRTVGPTLAWASRFFGYDHAAISHPWLSVQDERGAPLRAIPPSCAVSGVMARLDLERGPHVAPANAPLVGVVATTQPLSPRDLDQMHEVGVNPVRARPGAPVEIWGARTLATAGSALVTFPTRYVSRRRCLSAIEHNLYRIGQRFAFEPNVTLLRAQLQQAVAIHLLEVLRRGGLSGAEPAEAFKVLCDVSTNPQGAEDRGEVICEVHLALSYPAEFIVVRLGRREGVVEIDEVRP